MKFQRHTLETCSTAAGLVVVIDVIRAFTTAAFALGSGAGQIVLAGAVEQALELRQSLPGALVMGEVHGRRPPGFDLGNSPAALAGRDLGGRTLIQRTSAGTQGVVGVFAGQDGHRPDAVLAASFPVAGATAALIRRQAPPLVSFVITGIFAGGYGDEDVALADYLEAVLSTAHPPRPDPYLERVSGSLSAREKFTNPADPDFAPADIACCTDLDRFGFAMPVRVEEGQLVMRKQLI